MREAAHWCKRLITADFADVGAGSASLVLENLWRLDHKQLETIRNPYLGNRITLMYGLLFLLTVVARGVRPDP
jgi:hypothetical protein